MSASSSALQSAHSGTGRAFPPGPERSRPADVEASAADGDPEKRQRGERFLRLACEDVSLRETQLDPDELLVQPGAQPQIAFLRSSALARLAGERLYQVERRILRDQLPKVRSAFGRSRATGSRGRARGGHRVRRSPPRASRELGPLGARPRRLLVARRYECTRRWRPSGPHRGRRRVRVASRAAPPPHLAHTELENLGVDALLAVLAVGGVRRVLRRLAGAP